MKLRVIDLGEVSPLRSQAVYHGIADVMRVDDFPVLALCQPTSPYVSIGLHQDVDTEIDQAYCRQQQLPIIRRHTGGGTVLLDQHQLFFQFIFPRHLAPRKVHEIYPFFLQPAVETLRSFSLDARFEAPNDIHVNGKKITGTGAATISEATVLVGNYLFSFNEHMMSHIARCPSTEFTDYFATLMQQQLTSLQRELSDAPTRDNCALRLTEMSQKHLHMDIVHDQLHENEISAIQQWEQELEDDEWLYQSGRRLIPNGIKVCANTYLLESRLTWNARTLRALILQKNHCIEEIDFLDDALELQNLRETLFGVPMHSGAIAKALAQANVNQELRKPLQQLLLQHHVSDAI